MRISRRLMTVMALAMLLAFVGGPAALSRQSMSIPDSPRFTVLAGDMTVESGEPFHLMHGYSAENLEGLRRSRFQVHVFMDGVQIRPTSVGCTIDNPTKEDCDKIFIWDFPEGLEETTQFGVRWIAPCESWIGFEWDDQTVIESCLDKNAATTNLIGDATLYVGEAPPEETNVSVSLPAGSVHGNGFTPSHDEAEYQIGGGGWMAADRVTEDGSVDVFDVAADVEPGDVVEVRIEGLDLAQLTIVDITFDEFDGDMASGTATDLEGHGLHVCWDDGTEDPEGSDCSHTEIGATSWEATDLGLGEDWTVFIQFHDDEGDIQEVVYTPDPLPRNPHIGFDLPHGNLNVNEFPAVSSVMVCLDDPPESPLEDCLWDDRGNTDEEGFFEVAGYFSGIPGYTITVEVAGVTKSLTIPELTFDALDAVTNTASGRTDLPSDGVLSVFLFTDAEDEQADEYPVVIDDGLGEWAADLSGPGVTADSRADVVYFDDDGDVMGLVYQAP